MPGPAVIQMLAAVVVANYTLGPASKNTESQSNKSRLHLQMRGKPVPHKGPKTGSSHRQAQEDGRQQRSRVPSDQEDQQVDVLRRHQKRNGAPRPPSEEALRVSRDRRNATHLDSVGVGHDSRSGNSDLRPNPRDKQAEKRNFWPEMWKIFIDEAKLEWRIYLSVGDAFPRPKRAKDGEISNILQQMFQQFKRAGRRLEADYFPRYENELCTLVRYVV